MKTVLGFVLLLKRERIRRRTYKTRAAARQDVFDYIEMFYLTYGPSVAEEFLALK